MLDDSGQKWFHTLDGLRSIAFLLAPAPRSLNLFVTLVTEVSLISREPNLRFERISISRGFL